MTSKKFSRAAWIAAVLVLLPLSAHAQTAPIAASSGLNSSVSLTAGDLAASSLSEILKIYESSYESAIVIVTYEPEPATLDVEIIDKYADSDADRARGRVQEILPLIERLHMPFVQRRFGIDVTQNDYRVTYYAGRIDNPVIRWEEGRFVLP